MQLSAIRPNFNYNSYQTNTNYRNNQPRTSAPSFKGALTEPELTRVIKMLAEKNTTIVDNLKLSNLKLYIDNLFRAHEHRGIHSVAIKVVEPEDLPRLLGESCKFDIANKRGVCIAVGDKYCPVENMSEVYEARTYLIKAEELLPDAQA